MGSVLNAALSINSSTTTESTTNPSSNINSSSNTECNNKNHKYIPNKKNKWNFSGDYHNNWEKNLIPLNAQMQSDYNISMILTKYWLRNLNILPNNQIFPEYINIIVAEFYVLPRCSSCGAYNNLWLNIGDGFIGCGRKFYALKSIESMGGNGCSLTHYKKHKNKNGKTDCKKLDKNIKNMKNIKNIKNLKKIPGSITVKLGTISATGADVFDYDAPGMIFNAEDNNDIYSSDSDSESDDENNGKKRKLLSLNELKDMLKYWGIEMNRMYLYDKTFHSNQMVLESNVLID